MFMRRFSTACDCARIFEPSPQSRPGIRTHVENEIDRARADVDTRTERRGSPHSLIAVKNQASYERRVAQRKQDLADFAALRR